MISEKTVGRLSLYRRLLSEMQAGEVRTTYSHEIAALARVTPAQVRRDLMEAHCSGNSTRGYDVGDLLGNLCECLDNPRGDMVAIIGVGNLGRALLSYFTGRRPNLKIVAAFDDDPSKNGRVIHGCRCYPMDELEAVAREYDITVAIIAVPAAAAQLVADKLTGLGVRGLLNFAPVPLHVHADVFVENLDMTISLEKVAWFARQNACAAVSSMEEEGKV